VYEDECLHDDVDGSRATPAKPRLASLTEKAQQLAAENLHAELNDLTHLVSKLDRSRKRRAQPLSAQALSASTVRGLYVASKRGLLYLVRDYQEQMRRRAKEFKREQALATGKMLKTGADPDLDVRHEVLPLSPLLVDPLAPACVTFTTGASKMSSGKNCAA
jgi:hypothetical protein